MTLTHVFVALTLAVFAVGVVAEYVQRPWLERLRRYGLALQLVGLGLTVAVLRPGEGTHRTPDALHAALTAGGPVFVDVFSNY